MLSASLRKFRISLIVMSCAIAAANAAARDLPQGEREAALKAYPCERVVVTVKALNQDRSIQPPALKVDKATLSCDEYPPVARRLREEGTVKIFATILADGRVANAVVTETSGSQWLDRGAFSLIQATNKMTPASADGKPVATNTEIEVSYEILRGAPPGIYDPGPSLRAIASDPPGPRHERFNSAAYDLSLCTPWGTVKSRSCD